MFSARQSISSYHRMVKSLSTAALAAVFATLLAVTALLPSAAAQSYDFCTGGTLDGGNQTSPQDLVITNMTCTVDGSKTSYYFGKVYIFGGGTLTFNNVTMDFYAKSILVQNGGVLQSNGTIGAGGQTLTIHLYGSSTDQGITCKKMDNGNVVDDQYCGVPTTVWGSNTYTHYPTTPCTKTPDLPGKVNDCFYPYGTFDQGDVAGAYFGRKVLALSYGGAINLSGFRGAQGGMDNMPAVTGSSWMRLNATLNGGEDALTVSGMPADWQPSDPQHPIYIVVTSTDYLPGHAEQLQVGSVSGSTVTLTGGTVKNPHWGKVYSLNNAKVPCNAPSGTTDCLIGPELLLPGQNDRYVDTRAAVGLLSRSIRIVSDGATAGSALDGYYGGHTVVRQGFMSYQIQGVEFYQLGQGGAIMHYPVHFHLARLTPAGTYVKDSSVWDSMTRWIVIHATQGVTLARNVGYKSIGHGYYLEDGTETDNVLNTNLGVFARAAVDNEQNPRKVPGILAEPGHPGDVNPYHSDWEFPTLFWIMNGWNDFQYNFASSAGTCGVCYWLLPGGISGPSQYEWFDGYAGQQVVNPYALNNEGKPAPISQAGYSPLKTFVGNSCTTAMTSFLNIGQTDPCLGVSNTGARGELPAVSGVAPNKAPVQGDDPYYPYVTALRTPTGCTGTSCRCDSLTPGCNAPCSGQNGSEGNCVVTTLDRYTTSFNWASKNFAAIWLRPWWFLLQNSAITDVQQGGLTFVTSGGYTRSEVAQGYWSLLRKSVLVGNTQSPTGEPANPYASSAGPFNPKGLQCQEIGPLTYCLSSKEGISYPYEFYSVNQKLFSIYDGPAYQERNAYLDIPVTKVGTPADCTSDGVQQLCKKSKYLYGTEFGVKLDPIRKECYLPNAGIAWKQSNGFFYPPAFHSDNLFFNNVAIRHFVIEPLFLPGTFTTDPVAVTKIYCTWKTDMFRNFTDVDRQTVLNDDDGSLTGLVSGLFESDGTTPVESISVNEDSFFNAPTVTVECSSDFHAAGKPATGCPGTANTSPYEYITTATIAKGGINRQGDRQGGFEGDCTQGNSTKYCAWGPDCTSAAPADAQRCYGVPLYRQYLTPQEWTQYTGNDPNFHLPIIRMMGQATGQRSTLTVNHGKYYIDDQVSLDTQMTSGANELNVYIKGETYYTYFLFAKSTMNQTYQMFVGKGLDKKTIEASVQPYRGVFNNQNYIFNADTGASFLTPIYDSGTGLVTITVNLSARAGDFTNDTAKFCQPATYCMAEGSGKDTECVCAPNTGCTDNSVCAWAIKDIDCPIAGCFAFGITLPDTFATGLAKPPAPQQFKDANDNYWGTAFDTKIMTKFPNAQCTYTSDPGTLCSPPK